MDSADFGVLRQHLCDDRWRDVSIMAAGLAKHRAGEIVESIITRGDRDPSCRQRMYLLALACLETAVELSMPTRTLVMDRVRQFVESTDVERLQDLASEGEIALSTAPSKEFLVTLAFLVESGVLERRYRILNPQDGSVSIGDYESPKHVPKRVLNEHGNLIDPAVGQFMPVFRIAHRGAER